MKSAKDLLDEYGIKLASYTNGEHSTRCPQCSHKRNKRNIKCLSVKIDGESACWHCHHCQWSGSPKRAQHERRSKAGKRVQRAPLDLTPDFSRSPTPTYIYRDVSGSPVFGKFRYPPGHDPRFRLMHPFGPGWGWGTFGADTTILYRADELKKAITDGRTILVVEGEKDADNLVALGFAATCSGHGASAPGKQPKWTKAHSGQLADADIVVLNDNDAAGYAHADATCRLSYGVAKRVRRLDLTPHWPDIGKGNDISDWLTLGHGRTELDALIASAPDYEPARFTSARKPDGGEQPAGNGIDDAAELEALARLAPLDYERGRKDAGKRLGISRLSLLDNPGQE
jgi:hypothetical protein